MCLLWYPAWENLFSIVRRLFLKRELSKADNKHLHHFLYLFIKNKKIFNNDLYPNTFSGILINIYMFSSSYLATFFYNHTQTLVLIILFNISIYLFVYFVE